MILKNGKSVDAKIVINVEIDLPWYVLLEISLCELPGLENIYGSLEMLSE